LERDETVVEAAPAKELTAAEKKKVDAALKDVEAEKKKAE
jgi:hypothetical protein